MTTHRAWRIVGLAIILGTLLIPATASAQATPEASPIASPVVIVTGCEGLGPYFQALAALTLHNEGLVIMRDAAFDALSLTDAEAATVVDSIDEVIPQIETLAVPEPARAYHAAHLELLAWYRALAANRDELAHQRLINDDRRLFSAIGQAVLIGQTACGYDVWTDAWNAAFMPDN